MNSSQFRNESEQRIDDAVATPLAASHDDFRTVVLRKRPYASSPLACVPRARSRPFFLGAASQWEEHYVTNPAHVSTLYLPVSQASLRKPGRSCLRPTRRCRKASFHSAQPLQAVVAAMFVNVTGGRQGLPLSRSGYPRAYPDRDVGWCASASWAPGVRYRRGSE
jgi:hypothetical protein